MSKTNVLHCSKLTRSAKYYDIMPFEVVCMRPVCGSELAHAYIYYLYIVGQNTLTDFLSTKVYLRFSPDNYQYISANRKEKYEFYLVT